MFSLYHDRSFYVIYPYLLAVIIDYSASPYPVAMLVYTICRLNGNKQHWEGKGKHGKGKKGFCVNCPNYFCLRLCQRGI